MLIDTHTHLFSEEFNTDRTEVVERAIKSGVEKLLLPNIDSSSLDAMFELCNQFPDNCYPMVGLHPGSVDANFEQQLNSVKKALFENTSKCVAVGEIGMDLYWDKSHVEQQRIVFSEQVKWAKELRLPIVIHAREAFDEIFAILDELNDENLSGVFHCFTGNIEQANKALSYGNFKLGIGGVLTYKKSDLPEVLTEIDLKHLVLETDSPYLPPVPFRGKRNESSYILHVAEKLTSVYNVSIKTIEEITTANAKELFNLR
ncbi:MAG: TatD family hydrolase [Crocinitomicaceae bacterium]|nr:TatD family hydrolase [Crocinitomicaceae bacterium]